MKILEVLLKIRCNVKGMTVCVYSIHLDWHNYIPYYEIGFDGSPDKKGKYNRLLKEDQVMK